MSDRIKRKADKYIKLAEKHRLVGSFIEEVKSDEESKQLRIEIYDVLTNRGIKVNKSVENKLSTFDCDIWFSIKAKPPRIKKQNVKPEHPPIEFTPVTSFEEWYDATKGWINYKPWIRLSKPQMRIAYYAVASDLSNNELADNLSIAAATASNLFGQVYRKLNVKSRQGLTLLLFMEGIISQPDDIRVVTYKEWWNKV